jgi:Zn-dependent peptidase ImmA (M78 family)
VAVNPDMVVLARESRGLSQTELATRIGVRQASVSKFETGLLRVSDEHVGALARELDYPVDFFEQPDRLLGFASSCAFYRKRQSLSATVLRSIHARTNIMRIQLMRLLDGIEINTEAEFPQLDIDEYDSPEAIARHLRVMWRLPLGPVSNVVAAIERAGGLVLPLEFGTTLLDAVSQWPPGGPPMIFVSNTNPGDRMRFTLTHELGHLIMHARPTEDMEAEADRFAAEFLMPAREVRSDLQPPLTIARLAALKPYWKVSIAALARRARDLGTIDQNRYRRLFTELGVHGYRKNEPNPIPVEEPKLARSIMEAYQRDLSYSIAELARVGRMAEPEFRSVYRIDGPRQALRIVSTQ